MKVWMVGTALEMKKNAVGRHCNLKKFCDDNRDILLQKRLGLYLCYIREDVARKQFDESYPDDLRSHPIATGLFGGECDFQNFKDSTSTKLNKEAILEFAQEIQKK